MRSIFSNHLGPALDPAGAWVQLLLNKPWSAPIRIGRMKRTNPSGQVSGSNPTGAWAHLERFPSRSSPAR